MSQAILRRSRRFYCVLAVLTVACSDAGDGPTKPGQGGPGQVSPGQTGGPPLGAPQGAAGPINPGRIVAHRLNNVEYDNTIRDLVGLDLKPSKQFGFPDDNYVEGFDNNADSLSMSPLLLEKYQTAVEALVKQALDTAPANAALRGRLVSCDPVKAGELNCLNSIVSSFATRAFRRPVAADEIASYAMTMLATAKSVGDGFEQALQAALEAVLLSPKFLFRVEKNPTAHTVAALGDYELASRLSYFLWSSMPDAELFSRAADKSLHVPATLALQVQRMLRDPKANTMVENLAGEWLGGRELVIKQITAPDANFDDALRGAMGQEANLFLREMLLGEHTIADLISAKFVFANQRLATHYGLPQAASLGAEFQKIPLTDAVRSAGILTQANFLTVSSQRDRTSPTRRGKWVSENLFCVNIPPPPPKIPELVPNDQAMPTSTRERLEAHRRKGSTCNGCHQFMDPLGLAFEHYDVVGRWRDTDLGAAIDATGEVPSTNVAFDGVASLASAIKNDGRFSDCIVHKFLTYALGRSLNLTPKSGDEMDDVAGVADVKARLGAAGGKLSSVFDAIAQSPMMTMRLGEE
jgi:hypothetical protein